VLKPSKNTQYWVFFEGFFLLNFLLNKPNRIMKNKTFIQKAAIVAIEIRGGLVAPLVL
jgi:hypothetical protein